MSAAVARSESTFAASFLTLPLRPSSDRSNGNSIQFLRAVAGRQPNRTCSCPSREHWQAPHRSILVGLREILVDQPRGLRVVLLEYDIILWRLARRVVAFVTCWKALRTGAVLGR
jgi:hypothetical protein